MVQYKQKQTFSDAGAHYTIVQFTVCITPMVFLRDNFFPYVFLGNRTNGIWTKL